MGMKSLYHVRCRWKNGHELPWSYGRPAACQKINAAAQKPGKTVDQITQSLYPGQRTSSRLLLGIDNKETLLGHPVIGVSWKGFVIENILNTIDQNQIKPYFYRTSSSNEIDLVLEKSGNETWTIEIKRTFAPQFTKGQRLASQDIAASKNFIIYPGIERFPLAENTEAVGLADFVNELMMSK